MTRRSSRAHKLKEENMGEESSPVLRKQLEFSHRAEPVIKTLTKNAFVQPPTFGDTKETTGLKIILPQWGDLFNRLNLECCPELVPHNDRDVRALDNHVFPNIRQLCMHLVP
jgi:hypothetical protein